MTDVTPRVAADALIIQSYTPEGFRIAGADYKGAVLLMSGMIHSVDLKSASELEYSHIDALKGHAISYLILGCGQRTVMLPLEILQELREMGIVAEAMSTGAACRTYNVLLAEGRPVAALLLPG